MDASVVSRRVALDILVSCLDKGQPLDDALARHQGFAGLDPRDRAFVRLLLATTLRRLGEIEEVLGFLVERPLEGANAAGRQVLRLGAAQLLFLGTPPHAAVDTSVRLVVDAGLPHLKGLANAVLRRVSRDGPALLGDRDPARLNTPQWLWESWTESYGEEATRAIAAAHLIEAPLDLTPRSNADFWAGPARGRGAADRHDPPRRRRQRHRAAGIRRGRMVGAGRRRHASGPPAGRYFGQARRRSLCRAGRQDAAARRGRRGRDRGRHLGPPHDAGGREPGAAGLAARLVTADAGKWVTDETFDAILLDAPCSGTGTLRRHPDIAWLKDEEDVGRLTLTQDRLLVRAADLLKPGGTLVYAVCSLQDDEGPARLEALLARDKRLRRAPVEPAELPGLGDAITPAGDVRTLPSMWAGAARHGRVLHRAGPQEPCPA